MPTQAFKTTLAILLFRAGPQDFPYSEDPALSRACLGAAILATTLFFTLSTPPLAALVAGVIAVGGVSMFTRVLLRLRKLDNRFVQTQNALFAVGSVLLVVMRLPASELVPAMKEFVETVSKHPEVLDQGGPEAMPKFPPGAALMADVLSLWFLAVTGHVFRHAANLGFLGAAVVALLCQFNLMMLMVLTAPLIALFEF